MMAPYEKLKCLADAKSYLKPDIHFEILDEQVMIMHAHILLNNPSLITTP